VADLSWGDTGKGKITSHLAKDKSYDYVCRWAGGNNAGHTVFLKGKKYKTHLVPSGVFHGIKSIIGPQCVVHPESLQGELDYLKEHALVIQIKWLEPDN
jgi:adenylosuccinate synthase